MTAPRIVLFALTGFGNTVLPALSAAGLKPELLVTRAETDPFPYYDEAPLTSVAEHLGVPYLFGAEGEQKVAANPPDIVLCATYHRLLRAPLLQAVRWAINVHPSLLPLYRGANPFYWAIRNGETETGVTAHLMTTGLDTGDIVRQERVAILESETQGSLRHRLAELAAKIAIDTLRDIQNASVVLTPQDETKATTFDRPRGADRTRDESWTVAETSRAIRALSPFPGLIIDEGIVIEIVAAAGHVSPTDAGVKTFRRLRLRDGDILVRLRQA